MALCPLQILFLRFYEENDFFVYIATISSEMASVVEIAQITTGMQLLDILKDSNVPDDIVEKIQTHLNNSQFSVKETFNKFKTPSKLESYLKGNFHYIPPQTVRVGEETFQFISLVEILKAVSSDKTIQEYLRQTGPDSEAGIIQDLTDGHCFQTKDFFKRNPSAFK